MQHLANTSSRILRIFPLTSFAIRGGRAHQSNKAHAPVYLQLRGFHRSEWLRRLVQFNLSDIGEGIAEVQLRAWYVKEGDRVEEFDELCAVESDKATVTITSRYAGTIKRLYHEIDAIAKVGQPLVDIEVASDGAHASVGSSATPNGEENPPEEKESAHKLVATPAVRRLVREHGLNPASLVPSGPDGRLLKEDVLQAIAGSSQPREVVQNEGAGASKSTESLREAEASDDAMEVVPIRGYARSMIKSMSKALEIPHFGYDDDYRMDGLMKAREVLSERVHGAIKLSYLPIIIKATSLALSQFPNLNASLDDKLENLIHKANTFHHSFQKHHNISLAMDTKNGLAVPNIKHCESKSVWQIAEALNRLVEANKEGRGFSAEDLSNGTFTLSNIGSIGGTHMKPIIFPPQLCIGTLGKIRKTVGIEGGGNNGEERIAIHHVATFSWAADHRVVDGATLAKFSNMLKAYIESPELMLAELK